MASGGSCATAPGVHRLPVMVSGGERVPTTAAWSERPVAHLAQACQRAPISRGAAIPSSWVRVRPRLEAICSVVHWT